MLRDVREESRRSLLLCKCTGEWVKRNCTAIEHAGSCSSAGSNGILSLSCSLIVIEGGEFSDSASNCSDLDGGEHAVIDITSPSTAICLQLRP